MKQEEIRREVNHGLSVDEELSKGVTLSIPRVRGWGDVMAILSLVGLACGGLVWGMKLESRYDSLDARIQNHRSETVSMVEAIRLEMAATRGDIQEVKALLQRGVLPVTEVRLQNLESRVNSVEKELHGSNRD